MTEPQQLSATGAGAELLSARSVFYLTNREQIERWADLRRDVAENTARWLEQLGEQLSALRPGMSLWRGRIDTYTCLLLYPNSVPPSDAAPEVGIGLGWNPGKLMPDGTGEAPPFVGIWTSPGSPSATRLVSVLDAAERNNDQDRYGSSPKWPRYRHVVADEHWWNNLDDYRDQLLDGVRELLDTFTDDVLDHAN